MSKYNRKQKAKPEDEFVSFWGHAFKFLEPYLRAIGITLLSAVAVWFVIWGISNYYERKSETAAEAFGRAAKIYDADLLTDEAPPKSDEENPIPRYKTEKERAEATLVELDALDKKYGGSDVAKDALIFRAGLLYDLGRYDEAQVAYKSFLDRVKRNVPLAALAREGIGLCDEAKGKLDDALSDYQALEPHSGEFYRDRALYDQARIYVKKGDKKKAAELYKQVLTKMPQSPLRDEIQTQLALIESP